MTPYPHRQFFCALWYSFASLLCLTLGIFLPSVKLFLCLSLLFGLASILYLIGRYGYERRTRKFLKDTIREAEKRAATPSLE
jgi:hypothetical protein